MIENLEKIFVVGIGGIGISALVKILKAQGKKVSGSDIEQSEITSELEAEAIKIVFSHSEQNLPKDTELLTYSPAVPEDNPERKKAKSLNIPQFSYPQALGKLSRSYEKVVAVAGTNGKTTTTAMIGWILEAAGLDPTVVVGSKVLAWNSNARIGSRKYLVLEADEYRRAFLNYHPEIAVLTNIEADHLDYYKDLDDLKQAFLEFTKKIKPSGFLVYDPLDMNTNFVAGQFIGYKREFWRGDLELKIPGKFNQVNAAAAATACRILGVDESNIRRALRSFTGTWRRFEKVGKFHGAEIVSDYAHHPTSVLLTLTTAADLYGPKKVLAIFQPHQHNRTKMLFRDFVSSFCSSKVENIIIAEIFDVVGREDPPDQDISSRDLVEEIRACGKNVKYAKDLADCEQKIRAVAKNYDLILIMGAGDVYKVANKLVSEY